MSAFMSALAAGAGVREQRPPRAAAQRRSRIEPRRVVGRERRHDVAERGAPDRTADAEGLGRRADLRLPLPEEGGDRLDVVLRRQDARRFESPDLRGLGAPLPDRLEEPFVEPLDSHLAERPDLSPDEVKYRLLASAKPAFHFDGVPTFSIW